MAERTEGYYWLKLGELWQIGLWKKPDEIRGYFTLCGSNIAWRFIDAVGPRIEPPPELEGK